MNRELKSDMDCRVGLAAQATGGGAETLVGAIIDTQGFDALTFLLLMSAIAAANFNASLLIEDGDDAGLADAAPVDDRHLAGLESETAVDETDVNVCKRIGYTGPKQFVRMSLVITVNDGNDVISGVASLGHPAASPVAQG